MGQRGTPRGGLVASGHWPTSRSAADRRTAALQNLANYFGPEALNPREVVEFNWSTQVWNRGCPVAVLAPGTLIDFGTALRTPCGRVQWAGTETSTYWNGYMDGARAPASAPHRKSWRVCSVQSSVPED